MGSRNVNTKRFLRRSDGAYELTRRPGTTSSWMYRGVLSIVYKFLQFLNSFK